MSRDIELMAAIIDRHTTALFSDCKRAAHYLYDVGFRMGPSDSGRLNTIETRLDRIEGYVVIK